MELKAGGRDDGGEFVKAPLRDQVADSGDVAELVADVLA